MIMNTFKFHKRITSLSNFNKNSRKNSFMQLQKFNFTFFFNFKKEKDSSKKINPFFSKKIQTNRNLKNSLGSQLYKIHLNLSNESEAKRIITSTLEIKNQKSGIIQTLISFFYFILKISNNFIKKIYYLIKKIIHVSILALFIYMLYQFNFFNKLLNKFVGDAFTQLKKLLDQLYIGDKNLFLTDFLCDILEYPRFRKAIDNLLLSIYNDESLIENLKILSYEVLSDFLLDPHYGAIINTLLVNSLEDNVLQQTGRNVLINFAKSEDFNNQLNNHLYNLTCDDTFRAVINTLLKSHVLHYIRKPYFFEGIQDWIKSIFENDYIFQKVFEYYYLNFIAAEQNNHLNRNKELELFLGLRPSIDDQRYIKCAKIDISDKESIEKFLNGKINLLDIFKDKKFDFIPYGVSYENKDEFVYPKHKNLYKFDIDYLNSDVEHIIHKLGEK